MTQEPKSTDQLADNERQPDIEVYIKEITVEEILNWLKTIFDSVEPQSTLDKPSILVRCYTSDSEETVCIPLTIYIAAAGKQYTSLWFQSNKTPWASDLDCATDIVNTLSNEVRCSTGGWAESEDSESQWWKVTSEGKTIVNWG